MARLFVTSINLNKNELQNARIQNLGTAPSSPVAGQIYYNSSDNIMYFYNGTEWISTSGSLEVIQDAIGAYVSGGVGLTSTYNDGTGTTTIDLDNTAVTAASYGTTAAKTASFTVDAQGRLTAASEQDIQIATSQVTGLAEFIDDTVGDSVSGLIKEGEGIDVTYDDGAGTLTIAAEDATSSNKGIASFNSTDFTVSSGAVTLNAERVEDIVSNLVIGGTGIDATYNDGAGSLTIDIDSTVTTNSGSQSLTNKTLGSGNSLGANLDAANFKITNLAAPTSSADAATKAYVDAVSEGLHVHAAARVYVALNIDLSTALEAGDVIDGVTLAEGNRVLVNGQTTQSQNGVYVVQASGAAVRATDFDTPSEVKSGDFIFVSAGTNYANTGWVQTLTPSTIGVDAISFTQFSGAGTYLAGDGLTLTGSTFSVDVTPSSGNASLEIANSALGVKVNETDGLEVTVDGLGINNGTGLTFSSGALVFDTANGYGTRKLAFNVGDAAATTIPITHNLATRDVTVHLYENSSPYAQVEADVEHTDSNNVTLKFAIAPTLNQYRVVIVG
jgi:hypothetical protein